jgi:small subunit ribosomal protein S6
MKFYETTYIVHSALQEGRLNDITESINTFVKSAGGEILYSDNWGRKKLSYMIDKQKYGTYIYFQFKILDNSHIKNLKIEFEHNPNILRSLIVKIDEVDVFEKKKQEEEKKEISKIDKEPKDEKLEENSSSKKE